MNIRKCASFFLAVGVLIVGCSKDQRDQIAEKMNSAKDQVTSKAQEVTKQASQKVSAASEQIVADGEARIKLDSEITFASSYVNLISSKGRSSVLQLRSYADRSSETLPAYFFQAIASSPTLNSLSGQSIQGTLFVKRDSKEPTWMSAADQPITLSLDSIVEGKLKGRFSSGKLTSVKGESVVIDGTFEAIVEGGLE